MEEAMFPHVRWQCEVLMKWFEMICFVDLPNLTSITSGGSSFRWTRLVTLESISQYKILMLLDVPNLQNVDLPNSFKSIGSKSISSIDCFIDLISFLDVSPILANLVN